MRACKAHRTDGGPCRANAMTESEFCFWHDPRRKRDLERAARRGGSRRTVELPDCDALTSARARRILAGVIQAVLDRSLEAGIARTVGYILQVDSRVREGEELEQRVEALERALEQNGDVRR